MYSSNTMLDSLARDWLSSIVYIAANCKFLTSLYVVLYFDIWLLWNRNTHNIVIISYAASYVIVKVLLVDLVL